MHAFKFLVKDFFRVCCMVFVDRFNYSTTNELNDKLEFCSKTFTKIKEEDNNKKTFHSSMIRVVARAYIV
jgi:hypothetical protein